MADFLRDAQAFQVVLFRLGICCLGKCRLAQVVKCQRGTPLVSDLAVNGQAFPVALLHDFEDTHHILLMAKEEDRIKFIENNYRVSRARTIQILKRMAKRRANLYSYFGKKDYDDPKLYDLVLNMSLLSIDKAEELICKLIKN